MTNKINSVETSVLMTRKFICFDKNNNINSNIDPTSISNNEETIYQGKSIFKQRLYTDENIDVIFFLFMQANKRKEIWILRLK